MSNKTNPNSPENLLGKWFYAIDKHVIDHNLTGSEKEIAIGKGALAHLLEFADRHNKLIEMYNWLMESEGQLFLMNNSRISDFVFHESRSLSFIVNGEEELYPEDFEDAIEIIRAWIHENACLLPAYLTLK